MENLCEKKLLKGKYAGYSFAEVLDKDIGYCQFVNKLEFLSPEMKEFSDWLSFNDRLQARYSKRILDLTIKRLSSSA